MKTWNEHMGAAPYALADLGPSPRLYNEAWWMRRDGVLYSAPAVGAVGFGAISGGRRPVLNDMALNKLGLSGAGFGATSTPGTAGEEAAAQAMADALKAHGYKMTDMPLYKAFQQAEGLTPDSYPGPTTMTYLKDVLFGMGVEMPSVKVYPWSAANGKYDGVNAPPMSEWNPGGSGGSGGQSPPNNTTTNTTTNTSSNASMVSGLGVGAAVLAGLAVVAYAAHKPMRGAAKRHLGKARRHMRESKARAHTFVRRYA